MFLDRFFARLGQQLPSGFGVRDSVEPDVKAQEVEALRQVNTVGFLWRECQSSFAQPVGEEVYHCLRIFLGLTEQSGKEAALLRLPPLETVHAPLSAHSLSTSRTTRLLLLLSL